MQPGLPHKAALIESLESNASWLNKSILAQKGMGSSAYRWSWGKWGHSYPETTGYLIPTLLRLHKFFPNQNFETQAEAQTAFLISIQNEDGSFPVKLGSSEVNVFDTSQILLGLSVCYSHTNNQKIAASITSAYTWLINQIDSNGTIPRNNLYDKYNPAYYLRVIWPILFAGQIIEEQVPDKVYKLYRILAEFVHDDRILNASFKKDDTSFSHTIMYSMRGLLECEKFIKRDASEKVVTFLDNCVREINKKKSYPGSFGLQGDPDYSFICSTGHLQLILCLLKSYEDIKTNDIDAAVNFLFSPIFRSQRTWGINKGAVPSSIPIYGKYQKYKYTNWTQKFYCDAIMAIIDHYYR